jgi:RimJ/RimL family protein N-acetyltransferase
MGNRSFIASTPWDSSALAMPTFEVTEYSEDAIKECLNYPGHYTIKVDPLANTQILNLFGFYYCDTLITPVCFQDRLKTFEHTNAYLSTTFDAELLIKICDDVFKFGRFHRDFHIPVINANQRYSQWLRQLIQEGKVFSFWWQNDLAGFFAVNENKILLTAITEKFQNKSMAKYWLYLMCQELFNAGHERVETSISAANLAAVNLHASLGFRFQNAQDVYHLYVV